MSTSATSGQGQQRTQMQQGRGLTDEQVVRLFQYHEPFGTQVGRYEQLRTQALQIANYVQANCPDSPERTTAIRKLQEFVMWANASIAINETRG